MMSRYFGLSGISDNITSYWFVFWVTFKICSAHSWVLNALSKKRAQSMRFLSSRMSQWRNIYIRAGSPAQELRYVLDVMHVSSRYWRLVAVLFQAHNWIPIIPNYDNCPDLIRRLAQTTDLPVTSSRYCQFVDLTRSEYGQGVETRAHVRLFFCQLINLFKVLLG